MKDLASIWTRSEKHKQSSCDHNNFSYWSLKHNYCTLWYLKWNIKYLQGSHGGHQEEIWERLAEQLDGEYDQDCADRAEVHPEEGHQ